MDEEHIDAIDIRAFFPIDLNADEMLIQDLGDVWVFKRLVLHDVTPVAGGVPDREKNRSVLFTRFGERILAPGKPVDRIVGMLKEVR